MSEAKSCLREWAPLSDLFNRLPSKSPIGIFFQDVKLTCVDVLSEYIALGTNVGVVYWYDRRSKDLQRLRCEVSWICTSNFGSFKYLSKNNIFLEFE